jgi:hypothetical protein
MVSETFWGGPPPCIRCNQPPALVTEAPLYAAAQIAHIIQHSMQAAHCSSTRGTHHQHCCLCRPVGPVPQPHQQRAQQVGLLRGKGSCSSHSSSPCLRRMVQQAQRQHSTDGTLRLCSTAGSERSR